MHCLLEALPDTDFFSFPLLLSAAPVGELALITFVYLAVCSKFAITFTILALFFRHTVFLITAGLPDPNPDPDNEKSYDLGV